MSASETLYAPRFRYPQVLVREKTQRVECAVYRNGAQVAVTSGTYTLHRPDTTKAVSAQAISLDGSTAYYSVTSTVLDSEESLGAGWMEEWSLLMADGITHVFRRDAYLGLFQAYPPVSDADILALYPDLAEEADSAYVSNWQGFGDSAWGEIIRWLYSIGVWPQNNVTTSALFDLHMHAWARNVFAYLFRRTDEARFEQLWIYHRERYAAAQGSLALKLDNDGDGKADSDYAKGRNRIVHVNVSPRASLRRSWRW